MAEGFARHLRGSLLDVSSAGTAPKKMNSLAVKVMNELGIDISDQTSKSVEVLAEQTFDYVITVCDEAHEHCPLWPGRGTIVHSGFDDPPRLAANASTEEEALELYRRVRDEIKAYVMTLPQSLVAS